MATGADHTMEWVIAAATLLGPIFAVLVTRWVDARRADQDRKLFIFRSLMGTRRNRLAADHVAALNLIEVEFHKNEDVLNAWKGYLRHLETDRPVDGSNWDSTLDKLLGVLLSEIAGALKFNTKKLDLFQGGYAPKAWGWREDNAFAALRFVADLGGHRTTLPVAQYHAPTGDGRPPQPFHSAQASQTSQAGQ